jgi:hypothetical protein
LNPFVFSWIGKRLRVEAVVCDRHLSPEECKSKVANLVRVASGQLQYIHRLPQASLTLTSAIERFTSVVGKSFIDDKIFNARVIAPGESLVKISNRLFYLGGESWVR